MKKVFILMVALLSAGLLYMSVASSGEKGDLHIFTADNKAGNITAEMLEKAFEKEGFSIGINSNIQEALSGKYNNNIFKLYSAISIYHKELTLDLVKKYPKAGVLAPMGISIYQTAKEDSIHIAVASAKTQSKIIDAKVEDLEALESAIINVIKTAIPTAKHGYSDESIEESRALVTLYEKNLQGGDWEEAKEAMEEAIEDRLDPKGFVMPSYFDFGADLGKDSPYDFFVTYSICKIDVINAVSKTRPEGAAFAPCTTVLYKKKDEDKIVVGFLNVYNWMSSAKITTKDARDALMQAQTDFEAILEAATK
jgi:uncharacterized protein (DUF302 family)